MKRKLATLGPRVQGADTSIARADTRIPAPLDRGSPTQRGYNYKWTKARLEHLAKEPLCRTCDAQGKVTAATIVDHIIPHRGDMALFWRRDLWQSMCAACHAVKSAQEGAELLK